MSDEKMGYEDMFVSKDGTDMEKVDNQDNNGTGGQIRNEQYQETNNYYTQSGSSYMQQNHMQTIYDQQSYNQQSYTVPNNSGSYIQGGVRCPRCGSTNLQAISDTHGKGAKLWKLCLCGILGLCGAGKTKTDHYWVCGNCGNKFKM